MMAITAQTDCGSEEDSVRAGELSVSNALSPGTWGWEDWDREELPVASDERIDMTEGMAWLSFICPL
jgi:hypothetical protein